MDSNEAMKNQDPDREPGEGIGRKKPEEILQLMSKSMDFIKDLMEENNKLRYRAVQIEEENRDLATGVRRGRRAELLEDQIRRLEYERDRLVSEYKRVEDENKQSANQYIKIEDENNNLANLYVCSFQLHSTLDFHEVIQIIMEIVINLIGAEDFGILLLDEKAQTLRPVAMEGMPIDSLGPVPMGEGVIGQTAVTGENYYDPVPYSETIGRNRDPHHPLVCIPLKIKDDVIGVIVLYKLLPQKTQFASVDYELFTLLAGHAATAIFSAKLYSDAQRKLSTMKGFMQLLTSSES